MTRSLSMFAAALLVLAVAGCSDDPATPVAAPNLTASASAPSATTPAADPDREACHAVSTGPNLPTWQDALVLGEIASIASDARDSRIASAGQDLTEAVVEAQTGEMDTVDANIALMRAHLAVAQACGDRFGDGPW